MSRPYRFAGVVILHLANTAPGETKVRRWINVAFKNKTELRAQVLAAARNKWPEQKVTVDVSTVDQEAGGAIYVGTLREPVARFAIHYSNWTPPTTAKGWPTAA